MPFIKEFKLKEEDGHSIEKVHARITFFVLELVLCVFEVVGHQQWKKNGIFAFIKLHLRQTPGNWQHRPGFTFLPYLWTGLRWARNRVA